MIRSIRYFPVAFALALFGCGAEGDLAAQSPEARWEGEGVTLLDPVADADGAKVQVDVGKTKVGASATALLRIRNVGRAPLALVAVDPPATVTVVLPAAIPAGDSAQAMFTLRPAEPGEYRLLVRLRDVAGGFEERIRFVGRAITGDGDDPGTDDPGTDDPGTDDPGTDDPGTDDPGTDDPGTDDPGTDDPGTDDPGTDDPGTDDPGTDDPSDPGDDDPVDPEPECWAHSDSFEVLRKTDVLWVIDNSGAVPGVPYLPGLWGDFMSKAGGVDYQVGVTTTGLTTAGFSCPGGANGGENGRLFPVDGSSPRIISSGMPPAAQEAAWGYNSQVGDCHYEEQAYEAARRALSPPLITSADDPTTPEPNDGNLGFLRDDADLAIIVLMDEADQSTMHGLLPLDYVDFFQSLKPGRPGAVKLHIIAGPLSTAPSNCWAGEADRLLFGVDITGGTSHDICAPISLWPAMFQSISEAVFSHLGTTFRLAEMPEDVDANGLLNEQDLLVYVDGFATPPVSQSRARVWKYDAATNTIRFQVPFLPAPGSEIEVHYVVACDEEE